jgi:hypothetical protein
MKSPQRLQRHTELSNDEKYQLYKSGFTLVNSYLDSEEYITAYLLTHSLLEDRIKSMWFRRKHYETGWDMDDEDLQHTGGAVKQQLYYLSIHKDLDENILKRLFILLKERNNLIHYPIPNVKQFKKEYNDNQIDIFRKVDKFSIKQKTTIKSLPEKPHNEKIKARVNDLNFRKRNIYNSIERTKRMLDSTFGKFEN